MICRRYLGLKHLFLSFIFLPLPMSTEYTFAGEKKHTTWTQVLKKSNPNSLVCGLEGKILRM